ncbi:MAG: DUF4421 domain-containing protein [Treponema sp.]|jgi:hypothetical protein|nr:DUF4421 domain-containing protein [Treponema sp.]
MNRINKAQVLLNLGFLAIFSIGIVDMPCAENSIVPFNENFAFNLYGNFNSVEFTQKDDRQYRSESPWSIGFGIRYKNSTGRLLLPLTPNNNSFNLQINSYYEKIYYELFFSQYKNFYSEEKGGKDTYSVSGFDILSAGILAGWIQNNTRHSLKSVYNLINRQTESSGSFLYGFGIFYTSIHAIEEERVNYSERQHLTYFGPAMGYSYTWVFNHDIFCNVNLTAGFNMGVNTDTTVLFVPQIMPKLAIGHHNKVWSLNVIVGCTYTALFLNGSDFESLLSSTMTVTFSKRF